MEYGTKKEIEDLIANIKREVKGRFKIEGVVPVKNINPKKLEEFLERILFGEIDSMDLAIDSFSKNILDEDKYPTKKEILKR